VTNIFIYFFIVQQRHPERKPESGRFSERAVG
jgi:hypothetical protein